VLADSIEMGFVDMKVAALAAGPILAALSWWRRARATTIEFPRWRAGALATAMTAASLNLLVFYGWLLFRVTADQFDERIGASYDFWGNWIGLPLILIGLTGAAVGKGRGRFLTTILALIGFMLWVPVVFF